MKVSVIQNHQKVLYDVKNPGEFDLATCRKLSEEVLDECYELVEAAARDGSQLIVTMEAVNTVVLPDDGRINLADTVETLDGRIVSRFEEIAGKYGTHIVAGLYNRRGEKVYNSGILFGPNGNILGIYDKVHLAFGEKVGLTPGDSFPVFSTELGNIGILICWDMQFPESTRELVLGGADIIVCPTWGWENIYGLSRAYENDICIAAAMALPPNGRIEGIRSPSCIVDGRGNIIAQGSRDSACIVTAEIDTIPVPDENNNILRKVRMEDRRPELYKRSYKSTGTMC